MGTRITDLDHSSTISPEASLDDYLVSARVGKTYKITIGDVLAMLELPTKASLGLGNVDNTADQDKPISTAMALALQLKAEHDHTHDASEITNLGTATATVHFADNPEW